MSALEADIAYFDAKLSMLEQQPSSIHLQAQVRVYACLESMLSSNLSLLDKRRSIPGMGTIEVVEVAAESDSDSIDLEQGESFQLSFLDTGEG